MENDVKIPPDINTRAVAMWDIISKSDIDFTNKSVVDFGCGHGEMLWRIGQAGAEYALGIDRIFSFNLMDVVSACENVHYTDVHHIKAHYDSDLNMKREFDIAICFSVLPYLHHESMLKWMSPRFETCLIEAQYLPEPYNVDVFNDSEMENLLKSCGFSDNRVIGKTYVDIRDVWRSIWICKR